MTDEKIVRFPKRPNVRLTDASAVVGLGWLDAVEEHLRLALTVNAIDPSEAAERLSEQPAEARKEAIVALRSMETRLHRAAATMAAAADRLEAIPKPDKQR